MPDICKSDCVCIEKSIAEMRKTQIATLQYIIPGGIHPFRCTNDSGFKDNDDLRYMCETLYDNERRLVTRWQNDVPDAHANYDKIG